MSTISIIINILTLLIVFVFFICHSKNRECASKKIKSWDPANYFNDCHMRSQRKVGVAIWEANTVGSWQLNVNFYGRVYEMTWYKERVSSYPTLYEIKLMLNTIISEAEKDITQ